MARNGGGQNSLRRCWANSDNVAYLLATFCVPFVPSVARGRAKSSAW